MRACSPTPAARLAFLRFVDWHRVRLVLIGGIPPCLVTAYGYTLLTGKGAQLVIGTMLMLTVPLRYMLRRRAVVLNSRGLVLGSAGYGAAVGGTVGAGVILLSLLMSAGLAGQAVIATDAVLSIFIGGSRLIVFGLAGAITAKTIAFALLIGVVAFPGAFLAKAFVAAAADPCAHRDPRRGGAARRRGDGDRRADLVGCRSGFQPYQSTYLSRYDAFS